MHPKFTFLSNRVSLQYGSSKFIKKVFILALFSLEIFANQLSSLSTSTIKLETGTKIKVYLAKTKDEQRQGLSGVKKKQFSKNEGMLFIYNKTGPRSFWMPDTYFPLDIYFLNKDFIVTNLERNLKEHPGFISKNEIAQTKVYFAKYVLELRNDSPLNKRIKIGSKLVFLLGKKN